MKIRAFLAITFWTSHFVWEGIIPSRYLKLTNPVMIARIPAFFKGGGGVQGQKSWKHDFEITGDPKGPTSGSTFWLGFEAPDSYGYLWGRAPF